jgi:hypothetical protein
MFGQKRNSINGLKRNLISIIFLVVFMGCGLVLTGLSQSEINNINKQPVRIQVSSDEEFEEDSPELLEVIEIVKLPKHYY